MSSLRKREWMLNKSGKIFLLANIILVGFVVAVFFHYILGFYCKLNYPFNTFLFKPSQFFNDFTSIIPKLRGFAPYTPPADWQNYFPLAYLILTPFLCFKNMFFAYLVFLSTFLGFFGYWNKKFLKLENISVIDNFQIFFIVTFLSYPFLLIVDRGNFDMMIFILFAFFVFAFQEGKYQKSAILLGIINAMKPFSLLFLILFLFEKKYREFFLSIGTSFLLIIGGFMLFKGNIFNQISVMLQSIIWIEKMYILQNDFNAHLTITSSLFGSLRELLFKYPAIIPSNLISNETLLHIYKPLSLFLTAMTAFLTWREKVFWKRITLLVCYMLVVPHFVIDYKLIFLFVPLWLFINSEEKTKFDVLYVILFGLLLIPKRFIVLFLPAGVQFIEVSVLFNPFIMLFLMALIGYEQRNIKKVES